jgi:hypothetical protein
MNTPHEPAIVTGWGIHVPGFAIGHVIEGGDLSTACPPERAHELLGNRGLLYKEPATRLALCAVQQALGLSASARQSDAPPDGRVAVVAS